MDPNERAKEPKKSPTKDEVVKQEPPDVVDQDLPIDQVQEVDDELVPSMPRKSPMPSQESENSKVPGTELTDETPEKEKHIIHKLDICVKKLQVNSRDSIKVTQAFLDRLPTSKYRNVEPNYDSDATVVYWPLELDNDTKQDKFVITEVPKFIDALQVPVAGSINGHRTCIDTYRWTLRG